VLLQPAGGGRGRQYLRGTFSWATPAGVQVLGVVPADVVVSEVVIGIETAFDETVLLEVGTPAAPAQLMVGADSNSAMAERYKVDTDQHYPTSVEIQLNVLVPGPAPSTGTGYVLVYIN